eukprot:gene26954-biopygen17529
MSRGGCSRPNRAGIEAADPAALSHPQNVVHISPLPLRILLQEPNPATA